MSRPTIAERMKALDESIERLVEEEQRLAFEVAIAGFLQRHTEPERRPIFEQMERETEVVRRETALAIAAVRKWRAELEPAAVGTN